MHKDAPVSIKSNAGFNWARLYGLMAVLVVVAGGAATLWLARSEDARMRSELLVQGRLVADILNPWRVINLTNSPSDLDSPDYHAIKSQLQSPLRTSDRPSKQNCSARDAESASFLQPGLLTFRRRMRSISVVGLIPINWAAPSFP